MLDTARRLEFNSKQSACAGKVSRSQVCIEFDLILALLLLIANFRLKWSITRPQRLGKLTCKIRAGDRWKEKSVTVIPLGGPKAQLRLALLRTLQLLAREHVNKRDVPA